MMPLANQEARYLFALLVAIGVSLSLFALMQQMTQFSGIIKKQSADAQQIDFVRLIREPPLKEKKRELPKKPPPPKKKPPPPRLKQVSLPQPQTPKFNFPQTKFDVPLDLKSSLLSGFDANAENSVFKANDDAIPLVRVMPQAPAKALREGITGWVKLKLYISADGAVSRVEIMEAKPRRIFNRVAKRAALKWKFKPKLVDGKPVAQTANQLIEFNLDE